MRTRDAARWLGAGTSWLAFASMLGCEAQASDEYSGEPLLSLRGTVLVTKDQANSDLVPHLAFSVADDETNAVVLVPGELSGEFPAKLVAPGNHDAASCTRVEVACADDGRCRERVLECSEHPCDVGRRDDHV